MYKWFYSVLLWLLIWYGCWSQQIDKQLYQINNYVQNGDYFRATNLCNSLLKQTNLNEENIKIIKDKLDWINYFKNIEIQSFVLIRKGNYDEAIFTIKKTEQNGVYSTKNKDLIAILTNAKKYENTPIEQRYIDAGARYLESGDKEKAKAIFLQFKDNPIAVLKLKEIEQSLSVPILPCDEAKYASLRREMNRLYGECQLKRATQKANEILLMDCYQKDGFTLGSVAVFKDIQKQLRDIAEWKSGSDNSRREFIVPEYEKVFRKNRNCVEWDYFYYVYSSAEKMRVDDPCNKNAVSRYLQARRISDNLARRENIDQKIASIDQCTDCNSKSTLFVQITNEAQRLYKQCRYEEALKRYKEALSYNCSEKTQGIANVWENELLPQIERNQIQANRFIMFKSSADSLAALGECQDALKYYQSADSIQIDCIKLNKQDLSLKIERMQCCLDLKKFKGLRDTVLLALRGDLILNTDSKLNTRAFCRRAINALNLANNNKCIDTTEASRLFDMSCKICRVDFPTFFKCPIPPPDTIKKYQGFELLAGGFYNNPVVASVVRLTLPTWGWGGWNVGINYFHSFQSFGEWKIGANFSNNHFEIKQPFAEKENFDFQIAKLNAEFDWNLQKKKKSYPFLTLGTMINFPLKFTYQTGSKILTDKKLLANSVGLKAGVGYVFKRRSVISFTYDFAPLFQAEAAKSPILITESQYMTFGVNFRYRFLKQKLITKEKN
jgi:hypothetical protein